MPLIAEAPAADVMTERTVGIGEDFMRHRLVAVRSVTLQAPVAASSKWGRAVLPQGTQLFYARALDPQTDLFCGEYRVGAISYLWSYAYHRQWLCLEDIDADGVFDRFYSTEMNRGAYLPSFNSILNPGTVTAAYVEDAPDRRAAYEMAITYENAPLGLGDALNFVLRARRSGETEWNSVASAAFGVIGMAAVIKSDALPAQTTVGRLTFTVKSRSDAGAIIHPESTQPGLMTMGVRMERHR